ncbi:MAG: glycine--tRNA ligase subunit beta, partial [Candidatus Puniceispirillum sp.]
MADLLLELVSEEIPARMQTGACRDLSRMLKDALVAADLWSDASTITALCAPRHLAAYATDIATTQPDKVIEKRGPRVDAPDAAIAGFVKSAG